MPGNDREHLSRIIHDPGLSLLQKESGVELKVHVSAGARKTRITGTRLDALKISVSAPAREGKANKELCAFFADFFGIPKKNVTILRGAKSRQKILRLRGKNPAKIRSLLADVIENTNSQTKQERK
jgi:hypothetical protein